MTLQDIGQMIVTVTSDVSGVIKGMDAASASVMKFATKTTSIIGVIEKGLQLGQALMQNDIEAFDRSLEEVHRWNAQVAEGVANRTAREKEYTASLSLPERKMAMDQQIALEQKVANGQMQAFEAAKKRIKEVAGADWEGALRNGIPAAFEGDKATLKAAIDDYKTAEDVLFATRKRLRARQQDRIDINDDSLKLRGEVNQLTHEFETQSATLGMNAAQLKIYQLGLKGASEEQKNILEMYAESNRQQAESREMAIKLREDVDSYIESLRNETETLLKGTDAHKLNAIARRGVSEAILKQMNAELELKQAAQGEADDRAKSVDVYNRMLETTKQFQSPLDTLIERKRELDQELKKGLNPLIYEQAINVAVRDFERASNDIRGALQQVEGTLSGSNKGNFKIEQYNDAVRNENLTGEIKPLNTGKDPLPVLNEISASLKEIKNKPAPVIVPANAGG